MLLKVKKSIRSFLSKVEPPLSFLGGVSFRKTNGVRPYFGVFLGEGGPKYRTRRLIHEFGNYPLSPNIVYASSSKIIPLNRLKEYRKVSKNVRIVMNQNGLYYEGWYKGRDLKNQNSELRSFQDLSDYVFFQSQFCKSAFEELIGPINVPYEILHNGVPDYGVVQGIYLKQNRRPHCLVAGVFGKDSYHILLPALQAFEILFDKLGQDCPCLILAGYFLEAVDQEPWYPNVQSLLKNLISKGIVKGPVRYNALSKKQILKLHENIDVALHLKFQDPCPNAVLERMSMGIPHVYSNSGGTPELISDGGVPLFVESSWTEQKMVNPEDLASAIIVVLNKRNYYAQKARSRFESSFSWDKYASRHRAVFSRLLLTKT